MANYGVKVSKLGYSVYDPEQKQIMHSGYPLLKVAFQGTGTLSKNDSSVEVSVTINHNLGYIPIVFVYGQYIDANGVTVEKYIKYPFRETFALHQYESYGYTISTTQLIISYTTEYFGDTAIDLDYIYYICYDPAT
jgi:hypothetical protein